MTVQRDNFQVLIGNTTLWPPWEFASIAAAVEDPKPQHDAGPAVLAVEIPPRIGKTSWPNGLVLALRGLELKVPPVAVGMIAAALMWCAASATPDFGPLFPSNSVLLPVVLALIGAVTSLAGVLSFRRAKTTVNPMQPEATSALVVSGIYRYTRNPMYLGFLLLLLAWAVSLSNVLALASLPAFVLYMNRFQISPEERVLNSRFSHHYAEYCVSVRRWL